MAAGVIAPNGTWIKQAKNEKSQIVVVGLDPNTPEAEEAVKHRRPWRRVARDGAIYEKRFV